MVATLQTSSTERLTFFVAHFWIAEMSFGGCKVTWNSRGANTSAAPDFLKQ